jgi:hypothetical protein
MLIRAFLRTRLGAGIVQQADIRLSHRVESVTRMGQPLYPSLYQINTRLLLQEVSRQLRRRATLDDIPPTVLDRFVDLGFDWVWFLGVWQTGLAGRKIARSPDWRPGLQALLPDLREQDICGSPFAIRNYSVHADFGNDYELVHLRRALHNRGLRLLLDFVPNHTALEHPWVFDHPEFYVAGDETDLAREPHNYQRVDTRRGPRVLAHGRDAYFPGWTDTFQLNYRHPALREAMHAELSTAAQFCDGVRCDMAMLILPEVFLKTWGPRSLPSDGSPPADSPFWPEAIARIRESRPEFLFLAEVYWDLEWTLQQQGFDYTYDKRLYDRLRARKGQEVRGHLQADQDFQKKSVRFLENHDEPRAASAFPPSVHQAAALVTYFVPGMRFFHDGQLEGRRIQASLHLARRPQEPVDQDIQPFYRRLLECLQRPEPREGRWQLLACLPAWNGNPTSESMLAFAWQGEANQRLLITVNYAPTQGQCYVQIPWPDLAGITFLFRDLMGTALYERDGDDLMRRGLYLDLPPWGHHLFEATRIERSLNTKP